LKFSKNFSKLDKILNIAKISIIIYVSIYLIGNFIPYFEASDAYTYAAASLNLADGSYTITNELLQETGRWEFVPLHWTKTIFNSAVPSTSIGLPIVGSVFFSIFGYPSLFYLGPIFTIVFLIISERISTNLFGKYVGLFTLLLLTSNIWILDTGVHFMTDMLFASLFLVGVFYLIKFFHNGNSNYVLYTSVLLAISSFVRINGVVFFPIEIFLIIGFLSISLIKLKKYSTNSTSNHTTSILTLSNKEIIKISIFILIPWIIFFGFWFSFNDYFFGDPLLNYYNVRPEIEQNIESEIPTRGITNTSLFVIHDYRFDMIKGYLRTLLPSPFSTNLYDIPNQYDQIFGKYWLGFLSFGFLIAVLLFSFFAKNKRSEVFSFNLFIFGAIWFFTSSIDPEFNLHSSASRRYMIFIFPLFFMLLGFITQEIIRFFNKKNVSAKINFSSLFKTLFFSILILFFIGAFYFSPLVQAISNNEFVFRSPIQLMERYPYDLEGLSKNDIILDTKGYKTIEYGLIPFNGLLFHEGPEVFDSKNSIQESIVLLKELMDNGYSVYILKEPSRGLDRDFFKYLVNNHGFTIKDHSKSFCKIIFEGDNNLIDNENVNEAIDVTCINKAVKYYR